MMEFHYLFREVESHSESDGSVFTSSIFVEDIFSIDSLESFSIILYDEYKWRSFFIGRESYDRFFCAKEFDGILKQIAEYLLELHPIDTDDSDILIDPRMECHISVDLRVVF